MYICELLPLKTTKKIDTLSYFTALKINAGDLAEINMNGQILSAIVLNVNDIRRSKTELRSQDFKIKKINKVLKEKYISSELLKETYNLSTLLGTSMSNLFNTMLPINILEDIKFIKRKTKSEGGDIKEYKNSGGSEAAAQNTENTTNTFYISPTQKEVKDILKEYKKNKISINISTPSLAFLSNEKIDTVVINNQHSRHYYSTFKDVDTKKCIEYFCNLLNIKIIYAKQEKNNIKINIQELKITELSNKEELPKREVKLESIYLTQDNFEKIKLYLGQNKKVALYAQRLGNRTSITCDDCKSIQKCNSCDKPYILKKLSKINEMGEDISINYLSCSTCKINKELNNILKCTYCKSFRLTPMGIGVAGLEEHVKNIFLDNYKDKVSSKNNIKTKDSEDKNYIKIISEKDISTLKNIDLLVIISIDSLFSINEYNVDEQIFHLIYNLSQTLNTKNKDESESELIIQTRQDSKVFDKFLDSASILDSDKFYKLEYKIREKNNLPPYSYILTYESELDIGIPAFLKDFQNYKIKIRANINKYITKNKPANIKLINKYIFFISKQVWESDTNLREKCFLNLYNLNLEINPRNTLS